MLFSSFLGAVNLVPFSCFIFVYMFYQSGGNDDGGNGIHVVLCVNSGVPSHLGAQGRNTLGRLREW